MIAVEILPNANLQTPVISQTMINEEINTGIKKGVIYKDYVITLIAKPVTVQVAPVLSYENLFGADMRSNPVLLRMGIRAGIRP